MQWRDSSTKLSPWPRSIIPVSCAMSGHGRLGDGAAYLAMEWLEGQDLGQLLRSRKSASELSPSEATVVESMSFDTDDVETAKLAPRSVHATGDTDATTAQAPGPIARARAVEPLEIADALTLARRLTAAVAELPSPRYRPQRHQARQYLRARIRSRPDQADRSRYRAARRCARAIDSQRSDRRHAAVHGAGAGALGPSHHSSGRCLVDRLRAVSMPHRHRPVRRKRPHGRFGQHPARPTRTDMRAARRAAPRALRSDHVHSGQTAPTDGPKTQWFWHASWTG